ncbi:hypothetical protein CASFOL_020517 [Castilleja foliolosa]|uniref:SKP1 component POZ domain-containing protein n=1 Tax=Castilleja foliolosa TaxID=1961234 RepID=A0ABD3D134_9LAMI
MATADQSGSLIAPEEKKIVLRIRRPEEEEGVEFGISESAAALSETLKKMLEDGAAADGVITLPNVRRYTVPLIVAYLETHATVTASVCQDRDRKYAFDRQFAAGKDHYFLKGLLLDALTLKIEALADLMAQKIADYMLNKSYKYQFIVLRGREPTTEEKERWNQILPNIGWEEQRRKEEQDEVEERLAEANINSLI